MPPLQAIDKIYSLTMKMVYDRFHRTQKSPYLANTPIAKFQARVQTSRRYQVLPSGNNLFQVQVPDSGKKYVVNLQDKSCDCKDFYQYQSPCSHAIAAVKYDGKNPLDLFVSFYITETYRSTYRHPLPPISIEDLIIDDNIKPPTIRKQAGCPRTKRIRKGAWKK